MFVFYDLHFCLNMWSAFLVYGLCYSLVCLSMSMCAFVLLLKHLFIYLSIYLFIPLKSHSDIWVSVFTIQIYRNVFYMINT